MKLPPLRVHVAEFLRSPRKPPFAGEPEVQVVLPSEREARDDAERRRMSGLRGLLEGNRNGLAGELGSALRFVAQDPGSGARWLIGPHHANAALRRRGPAPIEAELSFDPREKLLVADAPGMAQLMEAFSLLRKLARAEPGDLRPLDCPDLDSAILLVAEEVADTFPAFERRVGIDWGELCERYGASVAASADPIAEIQAWLAELGDAHTWVRPAEPYGRLSFQTCRVADAVVLTEVPLDSPAWAAGARAGFRLEGEDVRGWGRRTAASPHSRALVTALRMFSGPPGELRELRARAASGALITWSEPYTAPRYEIRASRLPSGAGYLRIPGFVDPDGRFEATIDAALEDFRGAPGLVVDLRGNGGGRTQLGAVLQARFVHQDILMGSVQFSQPGGGLGPPHRWYAAPAPAEKRWHGRVRFLTDPLTYSTSEGALLGLQGLAHVQVIGQSSGGGSGQARSLRLLRGWRLAVSTCLTFDRSARCIEAVGIPVDRRLPSGELGVMDEAELLRIADAW